MEMLPNQWLLVPTAQAILVLLKFVHHALAHLWTHGSELWANPRQSKKPTTTDALTEC